MHKDLRDLLIDELHDMLSSEEQIVKALPEMVKAAESPDLKQAFEAHLKETKNQVKRLTKIFKLLKVKRTAKLCQGTKGLIQECKDVLKDFKTKSAIRDAALISKAQRIEHYEISAYGTMRTYANDLDLNTVANLLQETLDEEANADKKLSKIAEGGFFRTGINLQANMPSTNKPKELKKKAKPKELKKKAVKPKVVKKTSSSPKMSLRKGSGSKKVKPSTKKRKPLAKK